MIRSLQRRLALALAGAMLTGAVFAQTATPPDELVKRISTEVLTTIQSDKGLQDGNIDKVAKLVDEKILPHTDFARMTAAAVGPGWRQATPAQQARLTELFKQLLIRTYAGAFSQTRNVTIEFKPVRVPAEGDVTVRSQVLQPQAEPIQLDYRMSKSADGWKIIDVNVLGIWLVQNYRNSFAQEVNRNGVDGLIKSLEQKIAELGGKK
ncbi:MAG TPA: ABC transporter substrate-binding protein [Burkholderiaceae bacterium]|nr:ABC transporter substrate-binding protein [Burkholderiaceae bacterium]